SFKKPSYHRYMEEEYRNTEVIKTYGRTYEQTLAKAKYWITNYRVLDHIYPGKDQVYVQCWHGTPLKRLGYDLDHSDNAMNSTDEIWDKYKIDAEKFTWMISPSSFATEKFISAWNLKEFGREDVIIEEGYPRNDILTNYDEELKDFTKECIGISDMGEKKIILYAPTWRDNQHVAGLGYTYDMHLDLDRLQRELGEDYILLCRLHYLVANSIDFEKYEGFIYDVSKYDDINELYIISDLLITDYSSVFFDYANLKKPILFYMYDLEEYRDDIRGFYIDINELPGEIITEEDRLIQAVKEVGDGFVPDEKYMAFNSRYNYLDDGNAAKRTVRKILGKDNNSND
ncbi:MAG TPA: CDP-glycerol glycerophosphotransferase family protein, partial [Bacillota bacterium]|nr:CDP-glycerol glycerophosphotransferase family protein [Bacillota bacterium]